MHRAPRTASSTRVRMEGWRIRMKAKTNNTSVLTGGCLLMEADYERNFRGRRFKLFARRRPNSCPWLTWASMVYVLFRTIIVPSRCDPHHDAPTKSTVKILNQSPATSAEPRRANSLRAIWLAVRSRPSSRADCRGRRAGRPGRCESSRRPAGASIPG
jgi:hypothetical protein